MNENLDIRTPPFFPAPPKTKEEILPFLERLMIALDRHYKEDTQVKKQIQAHTHMSSEVTP